MTVEAQPLRSNRRTAWARNLAAPVRSFLSAETGGASVILGAVVVALAWVNVSPHSYDSFWRTRLAITVGQTGIAADLRQWVN
jgi:Na+/H+ antiporter NhaA